MIRQFFFLAGFFFGLGPLLPWKTAHTVDRGREFNPGTGYGCALTPGPHDVEP